MEDAVQEFEESILFYADAYNTHGPGSRRNSAFTSTEMTPDLSPSTSPRKGSFSAESYSSSTPNSSTNSSRRSSFVDRLRSLLSNVRVFDDSQEHGGDGDVVFAVPEECQVKEAIHKLESWQLEATTVDRSVQILPGVKRMLDSIPAGKYAVATSGAKTYGKSHALTHIVHVF